MPKPDFAPWAPLLSEDDLTAALLAAGIAYAHLGAHVYPFPFMEDELAAELHKILDEREGNVRWVEPDFFYSEFVHHSPPDSLVKAWKAATTDESGRTRHDLHVQIERINPGHLDWYASLFQKAGNIQTFFVRVPPSSQNLDWHWPIRVGFLPDEGGRRLRSRYRTWWENNSWAQGILHEEDETTGNILDILFIPDASKILSGLKACGQTIRTNCLFTFGCGETVLGSFTESIQRYQSLTQAMGFVFANTETTMAEQWWEILFRQLSHNLAFDQAIQIASNSTVEEPGTAVLFGSSFFINAARLTSRAILLAAELMQNPEGKITLDQSIGEDLDLEPGTFSASTVGQQLANNMSRFLYISEKEEATTISRLSKLVKEMVSPVSKGLVLPAPPEKIPERFLQHQLKDENLPEFEQENLLIAGHSYRLRLHIGPTVDSWQSLDVPFPEDQLPHTSASHLLTIILTEPNHLPEPQTATLILPPSGASNICDFHFSISGDHNLFEGRILVLYENRVLQTALLRSPIWQPPREKPEGHVEMVPEGMVRPLNLDLSERTRYDAAYVFNHTQDGEIKATRVKGVEAVVIDLADVKGVVKNISELINESDWEGKAFASPESEETLKLLRSLALHGSLLYRTLVKDMEIPEGLLNSKYIQGIMAREDYHFPIELCYQRPAPSSTAGLCPCAIKQLETAKIDPKCQDKCPSKDKPHEKICPLAFWGLNRVIEWHQFQPKYRKELEGGSYKFTNEPTKIKRTITPLHQILFGTSAKIDEKDVDRFVQSTRFFALPQPPVRATSWVEWEEKIRAKPSTLILMVHSELRNKMPSMEINDEFPDPPDIDESLVGDPSQPPLVLLLGCGTRNANAPCQSLASRFRLAGAAIVVSTLAELMPSHAPRLASMILTEMGKPCDENRDFGEVMLAIRRQGLLQGLPIALALVAYGDADWKVEHVYH